MSSNDATSPVLRTAYAVLLHSEHVTLNRDGIHLFASELVNTSSALPIPSPSSWADEPLHPIPSLHSAQEIVDWIFLVSLLNFSFWSVLKEEDRFGVVWKDGNDGKGTGKEKRWTGYWSLPAAINRATQDEKIPLTSPKYWLEASDEELRQAFRPSAGSREDMPLLEQRIQLLRQAGEMLCRDYDGSFYNLMKKVAGPSSSGESCTCDALSLAQAVVSTFPAFRDEHIHPRVGRVYIWKRPQILVAELWAAFTSVTDDARYPQITGIDKLTMFADYRVPQILHSLSLLTYSPYLLALLASHTPLDSGSELEISIRSLSIVCVEELRLSMVSLLEQAGRTAEMGRVNAVTLDFWLWNEAKRREGGKEKAVECHRTRSMWY